MRHALLLASVAVLSAGCGGPLLGAEADIEDITVTTDPIAFPDLAFLGTIAAGLDPGTLATTVAVAYDLGAIPTDQKGITPSLTLTGFALHLQSTAPLKPVGLREMDLMIVDPSTAATTLVARYVSNGQPNPMDVAFSVQRFELMPYLAQKKLGAQLRIVFDPAQLPNAFQAVTDLSFSANVSIDYLSL